MIFHLEKRAQLQINLKAYRCKNKVILNIDFNKSNLIIKKQTNV